MPQKKPAPAPAPAPGPGRMVYRALLFLAAGLLVILLAGSIYGLFFKNKAGPPEKAGNSQAQAKEGLRNFTGIGRLRISLSEPRPAAVIFSLSFPYSPEDKVFSEELTRRVKEFRAITTEYIGSFSAEEVRTMDEAALKAELLARFNAILRLGHIDHLNINDFMVIE